MTVNNVDTIHVQCYLIGNVYSRIESHNDEYFCCLLKFLPGRDILGEKTRKQGSFWERGWGLYGGIMGEYIFQLKKKKDF